MVPRRKGGRSQSDADSFDFLESTAEAAYVSDERQRIALWNQAATRLFGYDAGQMLGRRCYEAIRATTIFGNRFCSESCSLRQMARRGEPIHAFPIQMPSASGAIVRCNCTVIVVPGPRHGGSSLIHLLIPKVQDRQTEGNVEACLETTASTAASGPEPGTGAPSGCPRALTSRETQILRLTASGANGTEIAGLLSISPITVRNHMQHILYKLEVHNKLHAIFVARRLNLL